MVRAAPPTHHSVDVHDPSCLWVHGDTAVVPRYQVQLHHSIAIVDLLSNQLLDLLQLILEGRGEDNRRRRREKGERRVKMRGKDRRRREGEDDRGEERRTKGGGEGRGGEERREERQRRVRKRGEDRGREGEGRRTEGGGEERERERRTTEGRGREERGGEETEMEWGGDDMRIEKLEGKEGKRRGKTMTSFFSLGATPPMYHGILQCLRTMNMYM